MAISMFYGTKDDYIQVVVLQPRYHEKLQAMGWAKTPEDLAEKVNEPIAVTEAGEIIDKPELSDDVQLQIMAMDTKDEVELLLKEKFNIKLDLRGSLDTVKDKAIGAINESGRAS